MFQSVKLSNEESGKIPHNMIDKIDVLFSLYGFCYDKCLLSDFSL
jgi:hypothetical protein